MSKVTVDVKSIADQARSEEITTTDAAKQIAEKLRSTVEIAANADEEVMGIITRLETYEPEFDDLEEILNDLDDYCEQHDIDLIQ